VLALLSIGPADVLATHAVQSPCRFHITCVDGIANARVHARCRNGWDHPHMQPLCDDVSGDRVCIFELPTPCGNMDGCAERVTVPVGRRRVRRVSGGRAMLRCRSPLPDSTPCVTVADCPPLLGSPCRECVAGACFYDPRCY
jgi:hypothetical protein